jgi:hypothetical protein
MTPAERSAVAQRNQRERIAILYDTAAIKVAGRQQQMDIADGKRPRPMTLAPEQRSASRTAHGTVPHSCPRCGQEARGRTEDERVSFLSQHYNAAHPEVHRAR